MGTKAILVPAYLLKLRLVPKRKVVGLEIAQGGITPPRSCQAYVICQPIQDYGGGPGLLFRAHWLTGERFEVLGKAPFGDLIKACPAYLVRALCFSGSDKRPPKEPVGDGPDRAAPIAARVKARLFGTGARWQRPAQFGMPCEGGRV